MVHPQKRIFIKRSLECCIIRICEIKKDLIAMNPRPNSIYVHLDQLLFDLKYDPSIIEIPVPRYFKEDDRLPVDLQFKDPVERDGKKKGGKGKKKKKGGKKKKKKKGDDDEKKEPELKLYNDEKFGLMNNLFQKYHQQSIDDEPEEEMVLEKNQITLDISQAVRLIQKNDRGRQGRQRILLILKKFENSVKDAEIKRKRRECQVVQEKTKDELEKDATLLLQ